MSAASEIARFDDPRAQILLAVRASEQGLTREDVATQVRCEVLKLPKRSKKKVLVLHTFRIGAWKIEVSGLTRSDRVELVVALRQVADSICRQLAGESDAQAA